MPDAPGLELIATELNREFPGSVVGTSFDYEQAALVISADRVRDVLSWVRDQPAQGYGFLSSLHAADYLPAEPRFAVHYELLNRDRVERLRVKALLPDPAGASAEVATGIEDGPLPEIDSVTDMFPTANFQEREAYDFFGIVFRDHPNLTRILMPESYVGWPQRRDFPVGGEPVMFTKDEPVSPGWWK